ncbi:hypothetical protein PR048_010745 [Dryococelus australis]|uniref:MADF domain-containing protein n=1 Tax=Dryococelus australis TaxID=614101 RepID=A0ABQ9I3L3_9NEOP|nr:hypothetical protein PR048_010745 [Dryococelus australis]
MVDSRIFTPCLCSFLKRQEKSANIRAQCPRGAAAVPQGFGLYVRVHWAYGFARIAPSPLDLARRSDEALGVRVSVARCTRADNVRAAPLRFHKGLAYMYVCTEPKGSPVSLPRLLTLDAGVLPTLKMQIFSLQERTECRHTADSSRSWLVKPNAYSDREKKSQAYEALVEKYKEVDIAAKQRKKFQKKINSLRSVYRGELAKVRKAIRSGAGQDGVYKPSLWYYDLFAFLNDQETPRESTNTMNTETAASTEEIEEEVRIHIRATVRDTRYKMVAFTRRCSHITVLVVRRWRISRAACQPSPSTPATTVQASVVYERGTINGNTEDFVSEIEKYPVIWDRTSDEYSNKTAKRNAWEAVNVWLNIDSTMKESVLITQDSEAAFNVSSSSGQTIVKDFLVNCQKPPTIRPQNELREIKAFITNYHIRPGSAGKYRKQYIFYEQLRCLETAKTTTDDSLGAGRGEENNEYEDEQMPEVNDTDNHRTKLQGIRREKAMIQMLSFLIF